MLKNVLYVILAMWLVIACQKDPSQKEYGIAKPFTLYDTDSVAYSLKDYRGKIVMIHFWADWCPNCRGEFPRLQRAYEKLQSENFELLAVNSGQSKAHVREIRETYQLTYPLLVDIETKTAQTYGVSGLPSTYFIDKTGKIAKVVVGWLDEEEIISTFEQLKNQGYRNFY